MCNQWSILMTFRRMLAHETEGHESAGSPRSGRRRAVSRSTTRIGMCPLVVMVMLASTPAARTADWPTHRSDAARTGRSEEAVPLPLALQWTYESAAAPRPAWPRSRRMQFDRALPLVVAGDRVVFGSSVDGIVYALDGNTGTVVWKHITDGPIRFAPVIWRDQVFAASDDGFLYALQLDDGTLLWKRRGAPGTASVLGNGAMMSKWPVRGGPVVVDDVVYFAAGIWPSEGIYVHALDAETGESLWCNSESGTIEMPQPHPGANARSGISAQGYLVVSGNRLFVPTGRSVPACFDRKTGELKYFHLQKYGRNGDAQMVATGEVFFNGGLSFNVETGHLIASIGPGPIAVSENGIVTAVGTKLAEHAWEETEEFDRKGNKIVARSLRARWSIDRAAPSTAVIVAGKQIVVGSADRVDVVDMDDRKVVGGADVEGTPYELAVAAERLFVTTDRGRIYCFGTSQRDPARARPPSKRVSSTTIDPIYRRAAREVIQQAGVTEGYCLDLGCGDGSLALALAEQSRLQIIAVDADEEHVALARQRIIGAGLYGSRVAVQQRDPAATGFPRYFADLIVCGRSVTGGAEQLARVEARRLQRPYGGVICAGKPGRMQPVRRGPLDGAGQWTHQYADAANTVNSQDEHIQGRLGMLWFRDIDFPLAQRHGRPPAPLFSQGRVYHEGLNGLLAVNAYNGRELWRFDIPDVLKPYDGDELMGVAGTGSNFCIGGDSVYIRHEETCIRLDAASGKVVNRYRTPGDAASSQNPWGYIAWADGVLYGSGADPQHIVTYRYRDRGGDMTRLLTESRSLFAMDPDTGKTLWQYTAQHSIRHNAIAVGGGRIILIDRPPALSDRVKQPESKEHPTGTLIALDGRTGKELWKNDDNIYGTLLALSIPHDIVLMSYQPTRFRLDSERGGRMAAFRAADGMRLWDIEAPYNSRPIINDQTIYAQGGAWELLTGKPVDFTFERSYGCGILASSRHMLLFRSATLGYYDLSGRRETENYGGIRPGCWINSLPVGGIVVVPDATAGCECSYLNRAWIALEPLVD